MSDDKLCGKYCSRFCGKFGLGNINSFGIKLLVIGRQNWLFSDTPKGANVSAMNYSIIETAKADDLIVYDYLVNSMTELAMLEPDIDSLLPCNVTH